MRGTGGVLLLQRVFICQGGGFVVFSGAVDDHKISPSAQRLGRGRRISQGKSSMCIYLRDNDIPTVCTWVTYNFSHRENIFAIECWASRIIICLVVGVGGGGAKTSHGCFARLPNFRYTPSHLSCCQFSVAGEGRRIVRVEDQAP